MILEMESYNCMYLHRTNRYMYVISRCSKSGQAPLYTSTRLPLQNASPPPDLHSTMTPSDFIINDSEGESDGAIHFEEPPIQLEPALIAPAAPPHLVSSYGTNGYQNVPASGGISSSFPHRLSREWKLLEANCFAAVFPELRQKAIDEAQAALLSTPTQTDPRNSKVAAQRRQTAYGRLEGVEQDIYAFDASEDDSHPNSGGKKRKRPLSENKAGRTKKKDDDDGYEEVVSLSKKKPIKRAKSTGGGMSVLDLLNDTSEDDWRPNSFTLPKSGRKSTRGNTVNTDLLPPLPKPKRKPRETVKTTAYHEPQQFDGSLSLGFSHSDNPSNPRSAEIQVAATGTTSHTATSTFMIDLTHDELVLQNERRAEYDAVSPGLSTAESPQGILTTNAGGIYGTPDLCSTIPDPPYDPNLPPSQIAAHIAAYCHIPEPHPLAPPSVASDSPLSSLENSPAKPAKKISKQKKRAATDQHLGLAFVPEGDPDFGSFPIASEWRAAKGKARQGMAQATYAGRAKTLNAVDLFAAGNDGGSEVDDVWTGGGKSAAKRKKPAAKRRKSAANDDGSLGGETGAQKAKPKRRKSKAIETLIIGDTEDELSGGSRNKDLRPQGIIQVAATASAESLLNPQVKVNPNTDQKNRTSEDEPYDAVAVSNSPQVGMNNGDRLVLEEYKPPGHGIGVKKVHRWGRPKFLDEPIDGDDSLTPGAAGGPYAADPTTTAAPIPLVIVVEQEPELLPELAKPTKKAIPPAKRRRSKKDESEEEDWTGDPELTKKPAAKKETKAKTPRVSKKAAAAAAKEAKEQKEKPQPLYQTIKDSGDEDEYLEPTAIIAEPELEKIINVPELAKNSTKISGKKEAKPKKAMKAVATSKETVSDTDESGEKRNSTPAPQPKPETSKEEPQTPSKKLAEKIRKTPHSPINKGPVKFRVGLSRRAHIEPLLKIIRK